MCTISGSLRKRKREAVFTFNSFCDVGIPAEFRGPFFENIHGLLEFGHQENHGPEGMRAWSFRLEVNRTSPLHMSLFVVEEPAEGTEPSCCQCKYIGWGHHLVCNKKFHFVLPSKQTAPEMERLVLSGEDSPPHAATSCCERIVGWRSNRLLMGFLDLHGHILHGVIHYNGFGHLLCVNGIEGGSDLVCGSQIMDLWDRICTSLRVSANTGRQISINDISKKKSMDLRVLHGVSYGQPWFGKWGYKFGRGSFGVNHEMYQKSIEAVRSFRLSSVANSFSASNYILTIISKYQKLSSHSLLTLGHLFHYVMELKSCLVNDPAQIEHAVLPVNQCRWSSKRVEMATLVIIESLKNSGSKWVSRQQVRDSARAYIGDTGLLDFVLKSLGNQVIGNYIVRRAVNPVTRVLEYCLEEANNCLNNSDSISNAKKVSSNSQLGLTHLQLMRDLLYLYSTILRQFRPVCELTRAILDAKYLIKDYSEEVLKVECHNRDKLTFLCAVSVSGDEEQAENERSRRLLPHEVITLSHRATVGDLKREVMRHFGEIYFSLRSFGAESLLEFNADDKDLLCQIVNSGSKLVINGRVKEKALLCENGSDERIVYCSCGAKEDDGERMVCCDVCEVWQHTSCVKITNSEEVPKIFLCSRCEHHIMLFPTLL